MDIIEFILLLLCLFLYTDYNKQEERIRKLEDKLK